MDSLPGRMVAQRPVLLDQLVVVLRELVLGVDVVRVGFLLQRLARVEQPHLVKEVPDTATLQFR